MSKKKQRIRSPHRGITIKARERPGMQTAYRLRFKHPLTGKTIDETIPERVYGGMPKADAEKARTDYATRKRAELDMLVAHNQLQHLRGDRGESVPIKELYENYNAAAEVKNAKSTMKGYRLPQAAFVAFCKKKGVSMSGDISAGLLSDFKTAMMTEPRRVPNKGGAVGEWKPGKRPQTVYSINRRLRAVKTMLGTWRVARRLPKLDAEGVTEALKELEEPRDLPEFFRTEELRQLLGALTAYDMDTHTATRAELRGLRLRGTTLRHYPMTRFAVFLLLSGCRRGEALGLTWGQVDLASKDENGRAVGMINLPSYTTKTDASREVGLEVSPALHRMLAAMKLKAGKVTASTHVFGGETPYSETLVARARRRLIETKNEAGILKYGAPDFTWHHLRRTCSAYLTNAPGIYGGASAHRSAAQLGHSVEVAQKHYSGRKGLRGIPRNARTLEAAMDIERALEAALSASPILPELSEPALIGESLASRQRRARRGSTS